MQDSQDTAQHQMSTIDLSIVIPAFNEGRYIRRTIANLKSQLVAIRAEIIVVDNGSTDETIELARSAGADVILSATGNVAAVRNAGAGKASADVLMFLDADVFPTDQWARELPSTIAELKANDRLVTGSWVSVPPNCSWLERFWFQPLENGNNNHINSGHLILSKRLFEDLGGFDVALKTGEDYDLSVRARDRGAKIHDNPNLKVIHEGYPKGLGEFMRREIWHGSGDYLSIATFVRSKVAIAGALVFHSLLFGAATAFVYGPLSILIPLAMTMALSGVAANYRYAASSPIVRAVNSLVYLAYFVSRGISPYATLRRRRLRKSKSTRH